MRMHAILNAAQLTPHHTSPPTPHVHTTPLHTTPLHTTPHHTTPHTAHANTPPHTLAHALQGDVSRPGTAASRAPRMSRPGTQGGFSRPGTQGGFSRPGTRGGLSPSRPGTNNSHPYIASNPGVTPSSPPLINVPMLQMPTTTGALYDIFLPDQEPEKFVVIISEEMAAVSLCGLGAEGAAWIIVLCRFTGRRCSTANICCPLWPQDDSLLELLQEMACWPASVSLLCDPVKVTLGHQA